MMRVLVCVTRRSVPLFPVPAARMAPYRLKLHADLLPVMPMYSAFLSSTATCGSDYDCFPKSLTDWEDNTSIFGKSSNFLSLFMEFWLLYLKRSVWVMKASRLNDSNKLHWNTIFISVWVLKFLTVYHVKVKGLKKSPVCKVTKSKFNNNLGYLICQSKK